MRVADRGAEVGADLPLISQARAERPRILELFVEDKDVREEYGALRNVVRKLGIESGHRSEVGSWERHAAEIRHPDRTIGAAARGQVEAGNPRVVQARAAAYDAPPVAARIIGKPEARLEHLLVRWNGPVGRERVGAGRIGYRLSDERRVEHLRRGRNRVRLNFRFPPQPVVERPLGVWLPRILEVKGQVGLRDVLGPRFPQGATHPRLLEIEQDWTGLDVVDWTAAGRVVGVDVGEGVDALHVIGVRGEAQEPRYRAEDVPRVSKPDKRLDRMHLVVLEAELEKVIALGERDVVDQLHARVVVVDRQKERHAEPEVRGDRDVGEGSIAGIHPIGSKGRASWPIIRAGAILPRIL